MEPTRTSADIQPIAIASAVPAWGVSYWFGYYFSSPALLAEQEVRTR